MTEVQWTGLVVLILAVIILVVDAISYVRNGGEHRG